jgi:methionyl-tRNA formyltransferase
MPFPHVKIVVMKKKIIFMGSPAFAVPILKELANAFDIITAVTQPDRPTGRGRKIEQSPIKKLSLALGLPLIQPMKIREAEVVNHLQIINPDLIVVAAYGQIIPKNILEIPSLGCINVHASLLPRWRGASPIQAAILSGDVITGVSIMKMDEGLDTGPIIAQQEISISIDDTFFSLSEKLSNLGASLLIETLGEYFSGKSKLTNQDEEQATKTHLIKKEEGLLDLKMPAEMLERAIRAYNPWPGTFFFWGSHQIKVLKAHILDSQKVQPNQHLVHQKKPAIGTGHGLLIMDIVQPAGKKAMTGEEFLRGAHDWLNN